jgi:hypothetical protein
MEYDEINVDDFLKPFATRFKTVRQAFGGTIALLFREVRRLREVRASENQGATNNLNYWTLPIIFHV